jgi:hypothetical protein
MKVIFSNILSPKHYTLTIFLLPFFSIVMAQDFTSYHPDEWIPLEEHPACSKPQSTPQTGLYSFPYFYGDSPVFGYPFHMSLMVGLNDTLHVNIEFFNHSGKEYSFKGENVEKWFAPQVYEMWVTDSAGPKLRTADELGYRMRGWAKGRTIIPDQDILRDFQTVSIKFDFWNLPEGRNQLCLLPTGNEPEAFTLLTGGHVYEYYPPHSMADSINAYEACFYRALQDSNFKAAEVWTDEILNLNPYSVPGWWLKAIYYSSVEDTASTKKALKTALEYLTNREDPCMPDSSKAQIREVEQRYVDFMEVKIKFALE